VRQGLRFAPHCSPPFSAATNLQQCNGTLVLTLHSYAMRNFYRIYGVGALVGALLLFIAWLADRERQAFERLEQSETVHTLGRNP
jgi:hypothetical protein